VVEIITKFMRIPESNDNSEVKITHSEIAKRYFRQGAWVYEWLATLPLYLIQRYNKSEDTNEMVYVSLKLIRLVRIPRIIGLLDLSKINSVVETIFSGQTRSKKVVFQQIMKNVYKVFSLILLTIIITYFVGCTFYLISSIQNDPNLFNLGIETYITRNNLDNEDAIYRLITSCYFSITTLSTVGYGDLSPVSDTEKLVGIVIMIGGVAFFSYIMGQFIEIISNFN